ncbi:hypothetical protein Taro_024784 [Colocasia esculenta]|uniref:Glutaredoxin domain-containing protein n=1 Tax=Colocasia esculenta TaxID=4460 RepID=A0A843VIH9_COLES|nr:hypothetical protein [Colocasia esculenta]
MECSFSFHSVHKICKETELKPKRANESVSPEPMWMEVDGDGGEGDAFISDFDPDIISSFWKAFEELSPEHPFQLTAQQPDEPEKLAADENRRTKDDDRRIPAVTGIVQARISVFQGKINAKKAQFAASRPCKRPPGSEGKVVFYFTSLCGVRRTYEDCCAVRLILRSYVVRVDERDVSMHGGFKEELNTILGLGFGSNRLPRVFPDDRYLGGAEEVWQMHDAGEGSFGRLIYVSYI